MNQITIHPGQLSLDEMRQAFQAPVSARLVPDAYKQIEQGREIIAQIIGEGRVVYGVNTGFGRLAQTSIAEDQLATLQRNLVLSHAAGTGALLSTQTVRLIMLLKLNSLARGYSGVRPVVVDTLLAMLNQQVYPAVPGKGSVGASGDLAPLAHLTLPLIGEGQAYYQDELMDGAQAMAKAGIEPLQLEAKEGLALLNGTNVSTALALQGVFQAEGNFKAALVAGALTVDAALGSVAPFDPRVHEIRGHYGQIKVAEQYRKLLANSEINQSHIDCDRVQDPYSLRCQPQVMGACLDQLRHVTRILSTEANAVSDNPLIFAENGDVISAGNFHAEPVALAADNLAIAIAEIGSLSERRMALLVDDNMSQLPPFLVRDAGLNSGFMIAQVTAAALTSENKGLAHPASVDSLPTSANQEDHVSMATHAARRLIDMNDNLRGILAIELLAGAQGISLRRPLKSSALLEQAYQTIRQVAAEWHQDRYFAPDIEAVKLLIDLGRFDALIDDLLSFD